MSVDNYRPLYVWRSPASIPQIVAHIQDYLVKHPILSTETIAEIIVDALGDHPELLNGSVIPITQDSAQSIKAYIDSLPIIDTYTKAQIDSLLDGKEDTLTFDTTPTEDSANPVTSGGIYSALAALDTALQLMIAEKADISSVYTKAQTDSLLLDKANADDVYSKNTIEAKLLTKADIDSVYSIQDVDAMRIVNNANMAIRTTDNLAPIDISAGQYVYLGDILYMTTAQVLTGDELIPGTNCVLNPTGALNRIGDGLQNVAAQTNIQAGEISGLQGDVSSLSGQIGDLAGEMAYIENGNEASRGYTKGQFILWKGDLYRVKADTIISGATFTDGTNIEAVGTQGGLNALSGEIANLFTNVSVVGEFYSTTLAYTGLSVTIPANKYFILSFIVRYFGAQPLEVVVSTSNTNLSDGFRLYGKSDGGPVSVCGKSPEGSPRILYLWAKTASGGSDQCAIEGCYW